MQDATSDVQFEEQPMPLKGWETSASLSITELGLRARARNVLLDAGINTVGDVLAALEGGDEALTGLAGFGPKSLADLKEGLREHGFPLPGEAVPPPEPLGVVPEEEEALEVPGAAAVEVAAEKELALEEEASPEAASVAMEAAPEEEAPARAGAVAAAPRAGVLYETPSFGQRLKATLAQPREQLRIGGWFYGLIATVLTIIALLLPPISLPKRLGLVGFTTLDAENSSIFHPDGLTLSVAPDTFTGRLRVRLESVPRPEFLGSRKGTELYTAVESLPSHLHVKSPFYRIHHKGGDPSQPVMIDVVVPNAAEPWETLDLYIWTGEAWEWAGSELHAKVAEHEFIRVEVTDIPGNLVVVQADSITPTVSTSLEPGDSSAGAAGTVLNEVNPTGLLLGTDGGFVGDPDSLLQPGEGVGYAVLPTVRNWAPGATVNRGLLSDLLTMPEVQERHIANIVQLCTERGFAGVEVDYRGAGPDDRGAYNEFISALAEDLHAEGLRLSVAVEPPTPTDGGWDTGGYDWAKLGAAADAIKVPFPEDPTVYVEEGEAHRLLEWATARVGRYKLRMLVSSLSAERSGEDANYLSLDQALAPFGEVVALSDITRVEPGSEVEFGLEGARQRLSITLQEAAGTYRLEYEAEDGETRTIWLGTEASLATKLRWAQRYHLGGIAVADMLNSGNAPGIVDVVRGYRADAAIPAGQEMEVVWTVANAATTVDQQVSPLTEPGYTWMVLATTGVYTVNATVGGFDHGSVAVVVAEPEPVVAVTGEITETGALTEVMAAEMVTPTAELAFTAEEEEEEEKERLGARYLADVTIPDGTQMEKGEEFVKTWRVRNVGTRDWPEDTVLTRVRSPMGGPESVPVGAVAAGEDVEVSIDLVAPEDDGSYDGLWTLRTGETDISGGRLTAVIRIGEGGGVGAGAPPAAPAPVGGGSFEVGGQTHSLAHPNEMHYAGMNWVKFQVKWSPGMSGSDVVGRIQQAHANGFKVLLSAPGGAEYPSSIDFTAYVDFLRQVAEQGPDGIEVWNEQNIDREWPAGQIDATVYVQQMLAPAYSAIKSVNPNILVISGAPSPTGYFGGCSSAGCDDAPYVAAMLAAGAASYADCVGIHYNEGILPPSQTSGDPRGSSGHYTRYFWGMVNAYYNAFGGQRKLCFTELGYVSPEGYGTLPANFAWAADTSVAEQAAWLAESASLAASSGKVRLMIVYNVDFTLWSEHDPQAGYAMIRPGGGCPACDALHNVLGSR